MRTQEVEKGSERTSTERLPLVSREKVDTMKAENSSVKRCFEASFNQGILNSNERSTSTHHRSDPARD
jgi:hypothetical protein